MARPVVLSCNCPPFFPASPLPPPPRLTKLGAGGAGERFRVRSAHRSAARSRRRLGVRRARRRAARLRGAISARRPGRSGGARRSRGLALARERNLPIDSALAEKVERANAGVAIAARSLGSFARGLVAGEAEDVSGLAGAAVGDLFMLGDVRDALREGTRLASGRDGDELVLGLACVGLAVTAGTYATVGVAAPARVGLTVVKAARKTGRLGGAMAAWINRSLREVVDWTALKRAINSASIAEPAAAMRGAREAVRIEKAQELVRLVGNVGRVQARAGTRAALDGLKLAEGSRDMSKIARLAAAKGGKTRAILKLAGRGAIVLTVGTFNLATWLFWAIVTLLSFVSSLKRMTERITERYCVRRKLRRVRLVLAVPDALIPSQGIAA